MHFSCTCQRPSRGGCLVSYRLWKWVGPVLFLAVPTTPALHLKSCECPPHRSPESCWGPKESKDCTGDSEQHWWGENESRAWFCSTGFTWFDSFYIEVVNMHVLLHFQGHPILRRVLPSFCTSAPSRPAFPWRPCCALLLVLHVWMPSWLHCCCHCQPFWRWVTQSMQISGYQTIFNSYVFFKEMFNLF